MPEPEDDQVVLRVMACGVCGTDVHIYEGDEGAAQTPAGTTLGHEFAGVVTAVGRVRLRLPGPGTGSAWTPTSSAAAATTAGPAWGTFANT